MKTPMTKLKDTILEMINHGGTEEDLFAVVAHIDNWGLTEEKEQKLNLINFVRLNDKMGKTIDDLYNEFLNQNKQKYESN